MPLLSSDEGHWLPWTCTLAPEPIADFPKAVQAAQTAVESDPNSIVYLNTLGAILYRAG